MLSSLKDFAKGLARHWVWTLVFLVFLAPILVAVLSPLRAKLAGLPLVGKLVRGG